MSKDKMSKDKILFFNILSFDILSFDILSFDIISFDIISFDISPQNVEIVMFGTSSDEAADLVEKMFDDGHDLVVGRVRRNAGVVADARELQENKSFRSSGASAEPKSLHGAFYN
jgi:hypothetical protein